VLESAHTGAPVRIGSTVARPAPVELTDLTAAAVGVSS
jgi:hypothetical protein